MIWLFSNHLFINLKCIANKIFYPNNVFTNWRRSHRSEIPCRRHRDWTCFLCVVKFPTLKNLTRLTNSQLQTKRSGDNTTRDTWCNTCVKTRILSNPISLHGEICATLQHPERVKNSPASPVISEISTLKGNIKHFIRKDIPENTQHLCAVI